MIFSRRIQLERRSYRRIDFDSPIAFQIKDLSKFGGCLACDLSEGGVKVKFNCFVPLNTEMNLEIDLEGILNRVNISSRVVWVKRIPYSERYHLGLQFKSVDIFSERKIRRYIQSKRLKY